MKIARIVRYLKNGLKENGSGGFWKKIYRKPQVEILNINFILSLRILKQKLSMF